MATTARPRPTASSTAPPRGRCNRRRRHSCVAFDGRSRSCIQDGPVLPIDDEDLAVADDPRARPILRTISQDGTSYRQLTMPWSQGVALQIARDLSELESTLHQLRLRLVLLTLAGVAGAAALGWVLAGRIVRPVTRLRDAAEDIAATNDLTTPLPTDGPGEVGSLAQSLSSMMAALATSQEQQQRLVTDASHELRTPLTTLRTNVEHLQRAPDLPTEQRREVLTDIEVESRELTDLVNELVELSTDRSSTDEEPEVVDLADLAQTVAARAQRRTGRVIVVAHTGESLVSVRPRMVERAIANLVDNAIKYSPVDTDIDVTVAGPSLVVRDRGPGIDADDQPHVFDRFYRATTARTAPGSGLGPGHRAPDRRAPRGRGVGGQRGRRRRDRRHAPAAGGGAVVAGACIFQVIGVESAGWRPPRPTPRPTAIRGPWPSSGRCWPAPRSRSRSVSTAGATTRPGRPCSRWASVAPST